MSKPKGKPATDPVALHARFHGKIQIQAKVPMRSLDDVSIWYTPGVAQPCAAIAADPEQVYELTNRGNTVAVVSDGSRVLGLGDIGPEAALPVMEGKALLFKHLGGVDAVPICLAATSGERIIDVVQALVPAFGGINLEDIATPKCFHVLDALRNTLAIPVWHDDQQGTAVAVLGGLFNALEIVGKRLDRIKIGMIGIGAANMATYRMLKALGVDPGSIVACDRQGTLHRGRDDLERNQGAFAEKWLVCAESNSDGIRGGIAEALSGADVCLAFSTPGPTTIAATAIRGMAANSIVFACANPTPEILPAVAREAGARIVATGRSDFPNQVNNSLVFPGLFRGILDVGARTISDSIAAAAASALARRARDIGLTERAILPPTDDIELAARVAASVGIAAQEEQACRHTATYAELFEGAKRKITMARDTNHLLTEKGLIASMN